MTAETNYNLTCGTSRGPLPCNTTTIHCKNGEEWTNGLENYKSMKNCTQLLKLECYRPSNTGVKPHVRVCCIDNINKTSGNYTDELKGEYERLGLFTHTPVISYVYIHACTTYSYHVHKNKTYLASVLYILDNLA